MESGKASPDVLVVGGGAAGVAAAVGAARAGASVTLLERYGFLGGMATGALVGTVCGLYLRSESSLGTPVVSGFPASFCARLAEDSGTQVTSYREGLQFLPYEPLAFRLLCDHLTQEHQVDVLLHGQVTDVVRRGDDVAEVGAWVWDQPVRLRPGAVIDCSGTSALATLAGARTLQDGLHQAPALVFIVSGLAQVDTFALRLLLVRELRRGVSEGALPVDAEHLSIVPGTHLGDRAWFKLGLRGGVGNEVGEVGRLEVRARSLVREVFAWLEARVEPFHGAAVVDVAAQLGVRTGRRPVGRETLTGADVLSCRKRSDWIARGAWPVEHWNVEARPQITPFASEDWYDVPAGAVCSVDVSNLFMAGRLLSADETAIASARVIGTCLMTGYAAGTMAAYQVAGRPQGEAIACVQRELGSV